MNQTTVAARAFLERLANDLDVPPSRYEEAIRRYKSVGEWLDRDESSLRDYSPELYVQGSFRLGTPIRPVGDDEHYDVDLVCELNIPKTEMSQATVKELLRVEIATYAKAHGMQPPSESRRCWTLNYAEGAQFHLDALPAIPDSVTKKQRLAEHAMQSHWVDTALAITDNEHVDYRKCPGDWPHSNPKGFTKWFRSRMQEVYRRQRAAMALMEKAAVEEVPSYRVKTPLQQAVQILKRHRDWHFRGNPDDKPISIILTTLAGLSYQNEPDVGQALHSILASMDCHIEDRGGVSWIANPTDPQENFADRWVTFPQRKKRFYEWLEKARVDFAHIARQSNRQLLVEAAAPIVGNQQAIRASAAVAGSATALKQRITSIFRSKHKQAAPWTQVSGGSVSITEAIFSQNGFRPRRVYNDGSALPKGKTLKFRAKTDVAPPFDVYWQIVNTGEEATAAGGLRGGFDRGNVERGGAVRTEGTEYTGSHSIECFVVKGGYLVARSGPFIVNIA